MNRSDRVTQRVLRSRLRSVDLASALFGERRFGYARHRLLAPALRSGLSAFLHALEAAALVLIFDPNWLYPIFSLRLFSAIGSSFFWGATEAIRQDIRFRAERGEWSHARLRYEQALGRGAAFSFLILASSALWVGYFSSLSDGFSVLGAYALALGVRLSLSLFARVVHAGPGALRRVPRPPWSLFLPDLLDGLGLFLFWRWAGPWSVALSIVAASVLSFVLSIRYSWHALRDHKLRPTRFAWGPFRPQEHVQWLALGVLGLAFAIPSGMVLRASAEPTALFWYSFRPLASLVAMVPMLYYIDLVRARKLGGAAELRWVEHVRWVFGWASLGLFGVLEVGRWTVDWGIPWYFPLLLSMFSWCSAFLFQSLLRTLTAPLSGRAVMQVVGSLVPSALCMVAAWATAAPLAEQVPAVAGAMLLGTFVLERWREPHRIHAVRGNEPRTLVAWMDSLPMGPIRMSIIEVDAPFGAPEASRLAKFLATDERMLVTRLGRRALLLAEQPVSVSKGDRALALAGWGVERHVVVGERPSLTLRALLDALPAPLRDALIHPPGVAPDLPARRGGSVGSWEELASLVRAAGGARCPPPFRWGSEEVVVYVKESGASKVSLLPQDMPSAVRREVRQHAWKSSICWALERLEKRETGTAQPTK